MNGPIPAGGEAVPSISSLIMGTTEPEITHLLTVEELRKLSMKELRALLALFFALDETACAFLNQGRFTSGNLYNAAGEIGDVFLDHLNGCIELVEQVAKDAKPTTPEEAEDRAWLLIQRAAYYAEDLPAFVAATAHLSVEVSEVEAA
ncbi:MULTISPECIES: hypothetical protein [unclassified Shinella]|uniref:hypothetical protein n=1 Tax=unclassified Shinella TaxID=2643062 RepID=UPI00225D70FA|nr:MULTISPECIES: hypothetical protein [unclassified Shinella]MCO5140856.1 hypothetical protein [Shinella sp.]MDC7256455.1 hypothetical protein [Shinella sp. YE25]CAI0339323.1 conserved hypothetical protein [Rhizobiaceae bacterium]CAK7257730.1 conserved protein of unknown function [Shinella sp. WSC3-e]